MYELFVSASGIEWSDRGGSWKVVRFIQDTILTLPPDRRTHASNQPHPFRELVPSTLNPKFETLHPETLNPKP